MPARYWRIHITSGNGPRPQLSDIQMRATPGGADQTSEAYASASSVWNGNSAANAFDGSTSTRWYAEAGYPCWIQQDFGVETTVQEVHLRSLLTSVAPAGFDIQKSDDGATWETTDSYSVVGWPYNTGYEFSVTDASPATDVTASGISSSSNVDTTSAQVIATLVAINIEAQPAVSQATAQVSINTTASDIASASTVGQAAATNIEAIHANGINAATGTSSASVTVTSLVQTSGLTCTASLGPTSMQVVSDAFAISVSSASTTGTPQATVISDIDATGIASQALIASPTASTSLAPPTPTFQVSATWKSHPMSARWTAAESMNATWQRHTAKATWETIQ